MKKFNRLIGTAVAAAALLFTFTACNNSFSPQSSDTPQQQATNSGPLATPLTLEAAEAGAVVTFDNKAAGPVTYKLNGGAEQTIASGKSKDITLAAVGDKVEFFGDNKAYATSTSNYSNIACDKDCYVYGNIMSLVNSVQFEKATALEEGYTFACFFRNNAHIKNKDGADLLLPAATLARDCYYRMFYDCTRLTAAPDLPATTLARDCYYRMFSGCANLTAAPSLPATTLAEGCYNGMFSGCASLTAAPDLPATTLAEGCYESMFSGCASLTAAPSLPATTLANSCYHQMFYSCARLTAAPSLPATTLAEGCYEEMFCACTNLTAAPSLPATTLANYCYQEMFSACTNLTAAPDLPATTLANSCYNGMFYSCARLTTAPSLPATTLAYWCYYRMFSGCANLTAAPSLPATTLAEGCYNGMFSGCTSLASVTCLATDISAVECTTDWLNGVAASGTFTKASSMTSWTRGISGIPSGWTMENSPYTIPFTLEADKAGVLVTFVNKASDSVTYKVNGGAAQTIASGSSKDITLTAAGDKVEFFGDNNTYATDTISNYSNISCDKDCYVYGNIMSLVKSAHFEKATALEEGYTFARFFENNAYIKNKSGADLLLPATTLANSCYDGMFTDCTSLTAAPSLPAATLAGGCYCEMFNGCSKLSSVTCLATDISARGCTSGWLRGVAASGTFTKTAGADWSGKTDASGIPSGWTVVDKQ